jgi:hypothetical protein
MEFSALASKLESNPKADVGPVPTDSILIFALTIAAGIGALLLEQSAKATAQELLVGQLVTATAQPLTGDENDKLE